MPYTVVVLLFGVIAPSGPGPPYLQGFWITHNEAPQSVGLLWTRDQLIAETSTWQYTTPTTNIHAPGVIRTQNLSRWAAADICLWPRGHSDRSHMLLVCIGIYLKSVLGYKLLILDTFHPDAMFTGARMWWSVIIFRSQKASNEEKIVKHLYKQFLAFYFSRVFHCLHHNEIQTRMTQTSGAIFALFNGYYVHAQEQHV